MSIQSQCAKILRRLESGHSITQAQAWKWWGCSRLASRIYDLRGKGHDITAKKITKNGKQFSRYHMEVAK